MKFSSSEKGDYLEIHIKGAQHFHIKPEYNTVTIIMRKLFAKDLGNFLVAATKEDTCPCCGKEITK